MNPVPRSTVIAIEGHDGSGKTTLAKAIAKEFGAEYRHFGPPEKGSKVKDQYLKPLINVSSPVVLDRWGLGELIYGPMLRKRSGVSKFELKVLLRVFNSLNSVFVLSLLPPHLLRERFKGEQLVTLEQTLEARHKFADWVNFLDQHCSNFILHMATDEDQISKTIKRIREHLSTPRSRIYAGPSYGNIDGNFLIVGESVNKHNTWLDYPFTHGRCSEFLAQSLEAADIHEKDCYFVNADCLWFDQIAASFVDKTIICLGRSAELRCDEIGITSHHRLPHPQYWLRFKYSDLVKYHDFFKVIKKEADHAGV